MTVLDACALFLAALLGGALNSVAGGGSFIAFPTLLFTGVAPITANATTTVALWPGSVASVGAYRKLLGSRGRTLLLGSVSVVGGTLGAVLLLRMPQAAFEHLIPYLLLAATLLFAFSNRIMAWFRAHTSRKSPSWRLLAGIFLGIFARQALYLYGASSNEQRQLMPNYLLQWEAIRRAKQQGALLYDFWGIPDTDAEEEAMAGVYRFKRGWGGRVVQFLGCYEYTYRPLAMKLARRFVDRL